MLGFTMSRSASSDLGARPALRRLGRVLGAVVGGMLMASSALGQTFSNGAAITIPDSGTATPYPSNIVVAGGPASIPGITVTINGFTHTFPGDVAMLLQTPTGQNIQLYSRSGSGQAVTGVNMTFSSGPGWPTPGFPATTGTFSPAGGNSAFSAPAPAAPYAASLAPLIGTNSNGTWKLFVQDFASGDSGTIASGWSMTFGEAGAVTSPLSLTAFTYQGKLVGGATNGAINARFTLWA